MTKKLFNLTHGSGQLSLTALLVLVLSLLGSASAKANDVGYTEVDIQNHTLTFKYGTKPKGNDNLYVFSIDNAEWATSSY